MKRAVVLTLACLWSFLLFAQTVVIRKPLEIVQNSLADLQFNNMFGEYAKSGQEEQFPFVVLQIDLTGSERMVKEAKEKIRLDLGARYQIEAINSNQPNKLYFLLPKDAKNIYLLCGDSCEKQLLYNGLLIANRVYTCTVEYHVSKEEEQSAENAMKGQFEEMQQTIKTIQDALAKVTDQPKGQASSSEMQTKIDTLDDVLLFTVKSVTFKMKLVEGGTFSMGSYSGEENEKPVHRVTVSSYYIGVTEVTQELWSAVMDTNPSFFRGDMLPVEKINWQDCQNFLERLRKLTGCAFSMPTEAQWEYAARGGKHSRNYRFVGGNDASKVAWYADNSSFVTQKVGQLAPNELGLYDMSGNVWEWCNDWYSEPYPSNEQTDPEGPPSGQTHVLRGGGYGTKNTDCSPSRRFTYKYRAKFAGLRLVIIF